MWGCGLTCDQCHLGTIAQGNDKFEGLMSNTEIKSDLKLEPIRKDWVVRSVAGIVIALWLAWLAAGYFSVSRRWPWELSVSELGQVGDMFGSLNAAFTALAFVAVWWTGRMQRTELEMQREELRLQRHELQSTRGVLARQTFETMFFQMLKLSRELREDVELAHRSQVKGTQAMKILADECSVLSGHIDLNKLNNSELPLRDEFGRLYLSRVHPNCGVQFSAYLRTLYQTFKSIDVHDGLTLEDRKQYSRLARAQLNSYDLAVLAANACSSYGEGFRPLIEKYSLLKHYQGDKLHFIQRAFDKNAFED